VVPEVAAKASGRRHGLLNGLELQLIPCASKMHFLHSIKPACVAAPPRAGLMFMICTSSRLFYSPPCTMLTYKAAMSTDLRLYIMITFESRYAE
jgi:hypothetical protein